MRLLALALFLPLISPGATLLRLACGGPGGADAQGNVWQSDVPFASGAGAWTPANQAALSAMPAPYNALRYSAPPGASFFYALQVDPGTYSVRLLFVEPNKTAAGQRVFSVALNSTAVLTNLDLFAVAGALKPYERTFQAVAIGGQIRIDLTATVGNAVISGIQIDSLAQQTAGGAGMASQLGDFAVVRTSPTVLTVGVDCSSATPCNVRIGSTVYTVKGATTVTLPPDVGQLLGGVTLYVSGTGQLIAESDMAIVCSGACLAIRGGGAFPQDAIPIYSWSAAKGAWNERGEDRRALLSTRNIAAGSGIVVSDNGIVSTISLDPAARNGAYMSPLMVGPDATNLTTGIMHGYAPPCALAVVIYDDASPRNAIQPIGWSVDPVTCDVLVKFAAVLSNYYVVVIGRAP